MTITNLSTSNKHPISLRGLGKQVIDKLRSNDGKRPLIRVMFVVPTDAYDAAVVQDVIVDNTEETLNKSDESLMNQAEKTVSKKKSNKMLLLIFNK